MSKYLQKNKQQNKTKTKTFLSSKNQNFARKISKMLRLISENVKDFGNVLNFISKKKKI